MPAAVTMTVGVAWLVLAVTPLDSFVLQYSVSVVTELSSLDWLKHGEVERLFQAQGWVRAVKIKVAMKCIQ